MSTILATDAYRSTVAAAAATGGSLPQADEIAFGTGETPPSPGDTAMESELVRKSLDSATSDGVVLTTQGTLLGTESGEDAVTEVGVFAEGTLIGRRVYAPKQLEAESRLEFTLEFQF